jgi:phosphonate transport system substrate-binding protein
MSRLAAVAFAVTTLAACGSSDGSATSPSTDATAQTANPVATDPSVTSEPTVTDEPTATEPARTEAPVATDAPASDEPRVLRIGAIPDQDPEKLARLHGGIAEYLASALDAEVEYVPVTDYAAAVTLFSTGDLDLVWFGGLTGVQARLQTPGAVVLAQRDIDEVFQSVFIANVDSEIEPVTDVAGLSIFADRRFTFGSESSTSGRLMPQYFLDQAGIGPDSFSGEAGFSGSHDATVDLVQSGSFEGGALNLQVWERRLEEGTVDTSKVVEILRTPEYHDYHWILQPSAVEKYGDGFADEVQAALTSLSIDDPAQAELLDLFGAGAFIPADEGDYSEIEEIGRTLGLITS